MSTVRTLADLELVGNALCLDFANTVNSRHRTVHDYLGDYVDLLDWSEYAGAFDSAATRRLRTKAAEPQATAVLAGGHRLRDTIFAVFSAIARGRQPAARNVHELSDAFATAMRHVKIKGRGEGDFALGWAAPDIDEFDAPLWPVAHSAGELLLAGNLDRIGECPRCGWLFLDVSRNGTRRWCSMATCGSRDKMSRYHDRQRGAARS